MERPVPTWDTANGTEEMPRFSLRAPFSLLIFKYQKLPARTDPHPQSPALCTAPWAFSPCSPKYAQLMWAITRQRLPAAGTPGDRYSNALWQAEARITQAIRYPSGARRRIQITLHAGKDGPDSDLSPFGISQK